MLCYVLLCYVLLCHVISYHIISYYIILYYIILYYIILLYIIIFIYIYTYAFKCFHIVFSVAFRCLYHGQVSWMNLHQGVHVVTINGTNLGIPKDLKWSKSKNELKSIQIELIVLRSSIVEAQLLEELSATSVLSRDFLNISRILLNFLRNSVPAEVLPEPLPRNGTVFTKSRVYLLSPVSFDTKER